MTPRSSGRAAGPRVRVQLVEILYSKGSRGAPGATVRNRLPRAFPFASGGDAPYAFERWRLAERDGFTPRLEESEGRATVPGRQGMLLLEPVADGLALGLRWDSAVGQPRRTERPRAVRIAPGQRARLVINGRYTSHSGQTYTEATFNVAVAETLAADCLLVGEAAAFFDLRADLF